MNTNDFAYLLLNRPVAVLGTGLLVVLLATPVLTVLIPVGKLMVQATAQAW